METLSIILPEPRPAVFLLTMQIAMLCGYLYFFVDGTKRKIPFQSLVLIALTTSVSFVLGMKLAGAPAVLLGQQYSSEGSGLMLGRDALGGMALSSIALFTSIKTLRLPLHVCDSAAIALPLGLCLQRIGCFFAGCCHGVPTQLPWGVRYGANSHAFQHQLSQHLLSGHETYALAVHPTQLYMLLSTALTVAVLLWARRRLKIPGNLVLLSIATLLGLRFFVEFFRDSSTNGLAGMLLWNLKMVQWLCMAFAVVFSAVVILREKKAPSLLRRHSSLVREPSLQASLMLLLASFAVIYATSPLTTMIEVTIPSLFLGISFAMAGYRLWLRFLASERKMVYIGLVCISVLATSQSADQKRQVVDKRTDISLEGIWGSYISEYAQSSGDCETPSTSYKDEFNYKGAAIKTVFTTLYDDNSRLMFDVDVRPIWGKDQNFINSSSSAQNNKNEIRFSLSTGLRRYHKHVGYGLGLSMGDIRWKSIGEAEKGYKLSTIPSLNLRFGNLTRFYMEGGFADYTIAPPPVTNYTIGLGVAFNKTIDDGLRFGFFGSDGFYAKTSIPLTQRSSVFASYIYSDEGDGDGDRLKYESFNVGLSLRVK